ncbi:MAG: ligase-associated DNA damage response endonuclease PdeM [Phreatobacter sp.]|uniref:ligase-associated DNA damage response endonuclease PdeM n=1 Tax=Phreatobacter sp. TaxID=1966341 RepID=UPI001A57A7B4|nr:ligase-associated DNA damage response endonuclease PdeM [Phreatobacter sp.]MBL8571787.1 ligase-associated DNA damage response endonuclease PdeM [Phreatobacter sp.]
MNLARRQQERDDAVITLGGGAFVADPSGALWCARTSTLVVSDLHLEKGSAAARRGTLMPPYDTAHTLDALGGAIARFRPRRVISLGDSFHDDGALGRIAARDMTMLAELQRGRDWLWISGNHDEGLSGVLPGDHADAFVEDGMRFVHIPRAGQGGAEIAGHLHPCARIQTRAGSLRRRAFVFDGERLVMPAFGAYAGGLNARDPAILSLFARSFSVLALGRERVFAIPPGQCRPD